MSDFKTGSAYTLAALLAGAGLGFGAALSFLFLGGMYVPIDGMMVCWSP